MASNTSGQAWLTSQEEEMKPSKTPGGHQKLEINLLNENIGIVCGRVASQSVYW